MMKSDNHSHIILSSIDSMVEAARKKKVDHFAITEHVSQFKKPREEIVFRSVHTRGRMFGSFQEYRAEFEKITKSDSILVKMGLEVDYIPKYEKLLRNHVNQEKWDILLCSVHELSDGRDIEGKQRAHDKAYSERRWKEYVHTQIQAIESDFIPFDVLTHPLRLFAAAPDFPSEIDEMLLELARTARRRHKALELNGKDIELNPKLVERLAIACGTVGCEVSLGSDAHAPEAVNRNLDKASEFVNRFNLRVRA